MADQSIDLALDDAGESAVRTCWQAVRAAGVPSESDRRSPSHRPHVTLASADALPDPAATAARLELAPLLPQPLQLVGLSVWGRTRHVLAVQVALEADFAGAVRGWRAAHFGTAAAPSLHMTLARRLTHQQVGTALQALEAAPYPELVIAATLRQWNPQTRRVVELKPHPPGET